MSFAGWLIKGLVAVACILTAYKLRQIRLESRRQIELINKPDYIPPEPDLKALRRMSTATIRWQVGNIEVEGRQNLERCPASEPLIVIANHTNYADSSVIVRLLDRKVYIMSAIGILHFAGGLGAYMLKGCGVVPVEILNKWEDQALWRFSDLVAQGNTLIIYPEGWVHMDGITRAFKRGIVHIARESEEKFGGPIKILPLFISYNKTPGPRVTKLPPPFDYLFTLIAAPLYRGGAKARIGEPISTADLPQNSKAAISLLREKVLELRDFDEIN